MDPNYREFLMRILLGKIGLGSVSESEIEAAGVFAASFGIAWPARLFDDPEDEPEIVVVGGGVP